jgi:hypothetical protein
MSANIHASCIALGRKGVLLLGPSGAGKSDLALRLIDEGAKLVADDRTELSVRNGQLRAQAPAVLAGLIEVRGLGLITLPYSRQVAVALAVELGRAGDRLPERQFYTPPKPIRGVQPVPLITMYGQEASAAAKIRLVLGGALRRGAFTESPK